MFENIQSYFADYKIQSARRYIQNIVKNNIDNKIQKKYIQNDTFEEKLHPLLPDSTNIEEIEILV